MKRNKKRERQISKELTRNIRYPICPECGEDIKNSSYGSYGITMCDSCALDLFYSEELWLENQELEN